MDTFIIQDTLKHLRCSWRNFNEFVVYDEEMSPEISSYSTKLNMFKNNNPMEQEHLRYLAVQSLNIFINLHTKEEIDMNIVTNKSREYRAILLECQDKLTKIIETYPEHKKEFENYAELTSICNNIKDYNMMWHLAEILFIRPISDGYLTQELLMWLNIQQPIITVYYQTILENYKVDETNGIEENELYWKTVIGLGLQGRKDELEKLISLHSRSNGLALRSFREILKIMPIYGHGNVPINKNEFLIIWNQWKIQMKKVKESDVLAPFPVIGLLLDIFMGNIDALFTPQMLMATDYCWFNAIVPFLFYSQPMLTINQLPKLINGFRRDYEKYLSMQKTEFDDNFEIQDQTISALLKLDISEFISIISRSSNDWWLLAHLTDLIAFVKPQLFYTPLPNSSKSQIFNESFIETELEHLREHFILEYASLFVNHPSMNIMSINYYHFCPVKGKYYIEKVIEHMYISNEKVALQIYDWCLNKGYTIIADNFAKCRSIHYFKSGELGNSISWAIKLENPNLIINRIADVLLKEFLNPKPTSDVTYQLLSNIPSLQLEVVSKKMLFIMKMHEIREKITINEDGDVNLLNESIEEFVNLIRSKVISNYIMLASIEIVILPLLRKKYEENDNNMYLNFDSSATNDLLEVLIECADYKRDEEAKRNYNDLLELLLKHSTEILCM